MRLRVLGLRLASVSTRQHVHSLRRVGSETVSIPCRTDNARPGGERRGTGSVTYTLRFPGGGGTLFNNACDPDVSKRHLNRASRLSKHKLLLPHRTCVCVYCHPDVYTTRARGPRTSNTTHSFPCRIFVPNRHTHSHDLERQVGADAAQELRGRCTEAAQELCENCRVDTLRLCFSCARAA